MNPLLYPQFSTYHPKNTQTFGFSLREGSFIDGPAVSDAEGGYLEDFLDVGVILKHLFLFHGGKLK